MNLEDDHNINLKKFTRFDKKLPWPFIIKILIAILLIIGLYTAKSYLTKKSIDDSNEEDEIEILYQ